MHTYIHTCMHACMQTYTAYISIHTYVHTSKSSGVRTQLVGDCCLHKLGVLCVSVCMKRAVLFGVYITAPDFWKLPCRGAWTFWDKAPILLGLKSVRAGGRDRSEDSTWASLPTPTASWPEGLFRSKGFSMAPCYGLLLNSGGVCSVGPCLVYGT